MKKYLLPVCLLGFSTINLVSCYQDDEEDYFDFDDLSISKHTTLTRSGMNENIEITQNQNEVNNYYYKINTKYPKEENCCYLTVIVERWIKEKNKNYFYNPLCSPNANEYYLQIKSQFEEANPDWKKGTPIDGNTFMEFAGDLAVGSGENAKYLFSGQVDFNESGISASTFFNNSDNRKKVSAILLKKSGESGHMAYVTSCTATTIRFSGYDFLGNEKYKMNINGELGWTIIGVILK